MEPASPDVNVNVACLDDTEPLGPFVMVVSGGVVSGGVVSGGPPLGDGVDVGEGEGVDGVGAAVIPGDGEGAGDGDADVLGAGSGVGFGVRPVQVGSAPLSHLQDRLV